MKKISIFLILVFIIISLVGCGNNQVKELANEDIAKFASNDIQVINNLIFGTDELNIDDEMSNFLDSEDSIQNGILTSIFSNIKIDVKKVNDDTIEFKINAPNMENLFQDLLEINPEITQEELIVYIEDYIVNAKYKNFSVSIPYTSNNDEVKIDYQDENFINAITGGLLESYKSFYSQIINEYMEELD